MFKSGGVFFIPKSPTMWYSYNTVQWETFEGENFHGLVRSDHFAEKTFVEG